MNFKFSNSVVGGTFDNLHSGHKSLLDMAFKESKKVTIGLSTNELTKDKFLPEVIDDFSVRERVLKKYLKEKNFLRRAEIVPLLNIFGDTFSKNYDAIYCTKETIKNCILINKKRKKLGLMNLKINIVPLLKGEDKKVIKSERIRLGEIDEKGQLYVNGFSGSKLTLPISLRQELRKPFGKITKDVKSIKRIEGATKAKVINPVRR